jgi:hypothetical protein
MTPTKHYRTVDVKERNPDFATIHWCLIDGRLPIMAQYNPQWWCWLDTIPATREPQVIGGKGVSHWLEEYTPLSGYNVKEVKRSELRIGDRFYNSVYSTWLVVDNKKINEWYDLNLYEGSDPTFLVLVSPPLVDREDKTEILNEALTFIKSLTMLAGSAERNKMIEKLENYLK